MVDLGTNCPFCGFLQVHIPMLEVCSRFDHSKFGSFVGSIKVGSVRSKFGKDEVQTHGSYNS